MRLEDETNLRASKETSTCGGRVSDPHWFNADPDTDPDPAFFLIADLDPDPGFDDLKLKKITAEKNINFFWIKNYNLPFSRPPGGAFSPQKRTSSTSKHENSVLFSIFVGHFCPPGSGSGSAIWMRIRIQQLKLMGILADPDTDPDPKPCYLESQPCREMKIIWFSHWEVVL